MPGIRELIDHVSNIIGRDAMTLPPERVLRDLENRGQATLAGEVERAMRDELMTRMPVVQYRPLTEEFIGIDMAAARRGALWNDGPMAMPPQMLPRVVARPPAKEPTSTTAIGEAEAIDVEYAALVAELGVNSAAVDLEQFKALVPRAGLRVYHRAEVQEYLHCKYAVPVGDVTGYVHWGWRPLRAQDRGVGRATSPNNGDVQRGAEIYSKPIPYPVLLTVKTVRDACPSARFYVSDEMQAERIPDPFLLVEIAGEAFVIERWDEPAFRGKA